jgi:hypothetical protein
MQAEGVRTRVFVATALAGAAHLAFDGVTSLLVVTTPPYLLLDFASETFRDILNLDRRSILVAVAVISSGVNGAISGLFAAAFDTLERRVLKLGLTLSALWVFSGGLLIIVYLSPPPWVVAASLAAGIPRSFLVAWLLEWAARRDPAPQPSEEETR